MPKNNIIKVQGSYSGEVFTLDKDTGLVTYTGSYSDELTKLWNEALQWLPVKSISNCQEGYGTNFITLELTTGEVVRLCDSSDYAGAESLFDDNPYLAIGEHIL